MNLDFTLNEEQQMLRDMVRSFANDELKPIAAKIDEEECIPMDIIHKIGDLGILGAPYPEEVGGAGFGEVGYCLIQEEIGRACLSTATFIGAHVSIGTNAIYIGGTDEVKQKFLPDLTSGRKIASFALTEQGAGSDAFNLSTKAVEDGDDYVINGEKLWITNAPFADVFSVFARTKKGISAFVVEKGTPGLTPGAPEKKMGIRGSKTSSVTFDDVRVPKGNMIGRDGYGFLIAMKTLDAGRLGLGAACLGASKELLEMSVAYAKQRKQFGEPISNFQAVQHMISDMATTIYTMESILYRSASDYDNGTIQSKQSAMVKLVCSEGLEKIADLAIQIHGGMGYSRELPLERFYRDSRINRIFEGTTEVQKLVIARDVIKKNGLM
jgi:alkylation response protein AidB-like acyl-CoA dehydrogenase